ncbi:MAG TPA: glycogen debranching N-terminal domain-containing protein [Gemmatimonadaceae bacterium]|nr:glycogen debranching N-terminal domain-containing protein [Gemmatimonadaceae bacterium]
MTNERGRGRGRSGRRRRSRTKNGRKAELADRKQRILTHGTPSVTSGIADAIVTKAENIFFLTDPSGCVPVAPGHGLGLYYHDCRYLRGYEVLLGKEQPTILAATTDDIGRSAVLELANPDLRLGRGRLIARETVGIRWTRTLHGDTPGLDDVLELRNLGLEPIVLPLTLEFDARFEDLFAVRGLFQQTLGIRRAPRWSGRSLTLSYDGHDRCRRTLAITFSRAPESRGRQTARFAIRLAPRRAVTLGVRLRIDERAASHAAGRVSVRTYSTHQAAPHRALAQTPRTSIASDHALLDAVLARSFADLRLLRSSISGDEYYAAGVPWFATLFGRDAAITAIQMLAYEPRIAEQTARLLAAYQARDTNQWRDEQPGKILHSIRVGEMARLGLIPHTPYYGSVDATPLFLILMARHAMWTGDLSLFRELREHVDLALTWMTDGADSNGDGYIDYVSTSEHGLINQGWKDSGDAIVTASGKLASPPIALAEVQGYAFLARILIADVYERAGDPTRAMTLRAEAEALRGRFERDFWLANLDCYALALERDARPLAVVTSNAGQVLWSHIARPARARRVAKCMMSPDMFSGWGIRTLSTRARRFNPVGYHLGTVWPHDNALIATGFRHYGLDAAARRVFDSLLRTAAFFGSYRLPEVFAGFSTSEFRTPVRYPVACHPQAWAAGAVPYLLGALLGLEPDGFAGHLRVVRPTLPDGVNRLDVRNLPVGKSRISIRFTRTKKHRVAVDLLSATGTVELVVEERA